MQPSTSIFQVGVVALLATAAYAAPAAAPSEFPGVHLHGVPLATPSTFPVATSESAGSAVSTSTSPQSTVLSDPKLPLMGVWPGLNKRDDPSVVAGSPVSHPGPNKPKNGNPNNPKISSSKRMQKRAGPKTAQPAKAQPTWVLGSPVSFPAPGSAKNSTSS